MNDDAQVMRLPRYARGLKLVRIGVFLMLAQLVMSAVLIAKMLSASGLGGANDMIDWLKYTLWANLAAVGAMLVGTLLAVPDFRAARQSLRPVITAAIGFSVALASLAWAYFALMGFLDLAEHARSLGDLESAKSKLELMDWMSIVKDLGYSIGLIAIVRSIRETAQANEHWYLRDAANTVGSMLVLLATGDIIYQLTHRYAAGMFSALIMLVGSIALLVYWVYCHLRLAKFLKGAAILVYEPHNLPTATVVSTAATAPAAAPAPPARPSARKPTVPPPVASTPSQPVIVVAAELRVGPTPRANTAPGAPAGDEPKFLR